MPKVSDIAFVEQLEMPTLSVRAQVNMQQLPAMVGQSYAKIAQYLGEIKKPMAGMPFVLYHSFENGQADIEVGFPVSQDVPGTTELKKSQIPQGLAAYCMYQGAYDQMEALYGEIAQWIIKNGRQPTGAACEFYFNGPEFAPDLSLTQVMMYAK